MSNRFRLSSILTALAVAVAISSAWAGEAPSVQGDAARVLRRAEGLIRQKHYQKAAVEFERASELAGGPCPECLLGVGRAYSDAGQIDAALQVSRMALALLSAPADRAQAYQQLGALLILKGDVDAAREAFRKAVELDASLEPQIRSSLAAAFSKQAADIEAAGGGPIR